MNSQTTTASIPYWEEAMFLADNCAMDFRTIRNMREVILPQLGRSGMYSPEEVAGAITRFESRVALAKSGAA